MKVGQRVRISISDSASWCQDFFVALNGREGTIEDYQPHYAGLKQGDSPRPRPYLVRFSPVVIPPAYPETIPLEKFLFTAAELQEVKP